ncbi:tRNA (adenosine(37)-N6)-threonylcarbamoyltransferase complex dimerization subunit type 1 TsaB [Salicibibacter cibarius]|uniref:tRNA (Adenosine(37)-N6)-threonylcarbamoyltransferase complex dimerization subunit type 1 TsaB n=1 Tax=Salicibibacter cibarius TaxID=2743000 RepID=A0A7T7CAT4_9BACI|nr:tRNA (adenosine(37)-N6)-threonylcarbamoyltransferase complex dimerization subunit type 1 TsaB [Salicibibacter cibarius]QQK75239.1 tRNA (adenosine(37)-N6)-threonylcarbamoyltransferase complex dimerization subunit type 1 TsaB [Salicibibacter cibarius]
MILAMDTSTYVLGVALGDSSTIRAEWTTHEKKNHSLRLMPGIDHVMKTVNASPSDLEGIAVTTGPGSYTGVRIGVATAKGMASALRLPMYDVSSLEALAGNRRFAFGLVCPFIDARRGQVYAAVYEADDGHLKTAYEERLWLMDDLLKILASTSLPVYFLSLDVAGHRENIERVLGSRAHVGEGMDGRIKPGEILRIASESVPVTDVHAVVPRYLQLAEAEKNWRMAQGYHE